MDPDLLGTLVRVLAEREQRPPAWLLLTTAAAAVLAVVPRRSWRLTRVLVTVAHEGGHAVAALLTGRRLAGIRLSADTSGVTVSSGPRRGPGMVATAAAGYVAPALLGLGAAAALGAGYVAATLWGTLALLAALLLQIRNPYGALVVVLVGAGLGTVSWAGPDDVRTAAAYLLAWLLLLGAPRPVVELHGRRRAGRARDSDADTLARLTGVPAVLWAGLFLAVTLAALVLGSRLLLGR